MKRAKEAALHSTKLANKSGTTNTLASKSGSIKKGKKRKKPPAGATVNITQKRKFNPNRKQKKEKKSKFGVKPLARMISTNTEAPAHPISSRKLKNPIQSSEAVASPSSNPTSKQNVSIAESVKNRPATFSSKKKLPTNPGKKSLGFVVKPTLQQNRLSEAQTKLQLQTKPKPKIKTLKRPRIKRLRSASPKEVVRRKITTPPSIENVQLMEISKDSTIHYTPDLSSEELIRNARIEARKEILQSKKRHRISFARELELGRKLMSLGVNIDMPADETAGQGVLAGM